MSRELEVLKLLGGLPTEYIYFEKFVCDGARPKALHTRSQ